ncbi:calcium-binding protein [Shinella zoogloeoides]|uniref:Calcium-binding protein n=1 Tax=Shinella zoogloeoides TaxID=352475 RepID=A0A6N8TNJ2_SHIZO|nr:hypothetical protein [Shinella zoogloeoides]MXO02710.1 hypothetical protein [Shinella zoogloeoides]UEX81838.1 hypothetical protein K8M09_00565 [Shinella zoogloeoides]
MATLDIFQGKPDHDLLALFAAALEFGSLSGDGSSMTLTDGDITVTLTGMGLAGAGRTISGGQIGKILISQAGVQVAELDYQSLVGTAALQNAMDVFESSSDLEARETALDGITDVVTLVRGSDEIDEIYGSSQYFTEINGGGGDDLIHGGAMGNRINGGAGNDTIAGGSGSDTIDGGAGTDILTYHDVGSVGGITVTMNTVAASGKVTGGGVGTDTFTNVEIVQGSQWNDTFNGNAGSDRFVGMEGDDIFRGAAGTDTIDYSYEEGNYSVWINLGSTRFEGLEANTGLDSYNSLDVFNQIENIVGTDLDDIVMGSAGNNLLDGRGGYDVLFGGAGADTLLGGEDNDFLVGGAGNDILDGGAGDSDAVGYLEETGTRGAVVNLNTGKATDTFGNADTLRGIEEAEGSARGDTFTGKADGYSGFRGFGGADTFNGGSDTWLYYGQDASVGGAQRVVINLSGSAVVNAGSDNGASVGTLAAGRAKDGFGAIDILNNIHQIRGTAGDDWVRGSSGDDRFQMQDGNDYIDGGAGRDRVDYSHDRDEVNGDPLNGVIVNLSGDDLNAVDIDLGSGLATYSVAAGTARDSFGAIDTLRDIEQVRGTDDNDYMVGNDGDNEFDARGGDDFVYAGGGDFDHILGGSGKDFIDGQAGFDMLVFAGTNPDDILTATLSGAQEGAGVVTGSRDGGVIETEFHNLESLKGTGNNDTITAQADFVNTEDAWGFNGVRGFEVIGLGGADTFTDLTDPAEGYGSLLLNYDEEKYDHDGFDGNWNGNNGERGVKINLSNTTQEGVATNRAIDTFGDTDTIDGVRQFFMTDTDDKFWGREDGSNVFVDGRAGNDAITASGGNDVLWGGEGNDTIDAGDGDDEIDGWDGNDTINAGAGNDWIGAGFGVDTINGGAGFDELGYNGSSLTNTYQGLVVALNGADGSGTISGAVTFLGNNGEIHAGSVNGTTFQSLEMISGSNANDRFTVDTAFTNTADAAPVFFDYAGGDRGAGGAFVVVGNKGADVFTDNSDATPSGESGGTLLVSYRGEQYGRDRDGYWGNGDDEHGVIVNLSSIAQATTGFDFRGMAGAPASIAAHTALDTHGDIDTLNKIQMVDLSNADDWLFADDSRGTFANGFDGDDRLLGGGGDDVFTGGQGNDVMSGGAGYDALVYAYEDGWDGADAAGVYVNLSSAGRTFSTGGGDVTVNSGQARDLFGDTDTISGFELVAGTSGADFIVADDSGMHLAGLGGRRPSRRWCWRGRAAGRQRR